MNLVIRITAILRLQAFKQKFIRIFSVILQKLIQKTRFTVLKCLCLGLQESVSTLVRLKQRPSRCDIIKSTHVLII